METKTIRYNLKDRGRKFRGQNRNFNIRSIMDAINGPECQERVKNRDLHGFYGHMTRVKFGMIPNEGVMDGQDAAPRVIPAFVTTYLQAFPDGTVEHRAEFLDTGPGQVAAKLFNGRVGGFSSAIDENRPEFYGFDYVLEPNFTTNRGYALDDVSGMTLDAVNAAILDEQTQGMMALLDSVNAQHEATYLAFERLQAENEELLSLLARAGTAAPTLDSAGVAPLMVSMDSANRMRRDSARFMAAHLLVPLAPPDESAPIKKECDSLADRLLRNF